MPVPRLSYPCRGGCTPPTTTTTPLALQRFEPNQYFHNEVLARSWTVDAETSVIARDATPIQWHAGMDLTLDNDDGAPSFFCWFSNDHEGKGMSVDEVDAIADIIKDELWPNPVPFFLVRVPAVLVVLPRCRLLLPRLMITLVLSEGHLAPRFEPPARA